jgi:hypothetical protein
MTELKQYRSAFAEMKETCARLGSRYDPPAINSRVGFASNTEGQLPINGLRHLPTSDMNGWYIWCGENLPTDPNFFGSLHVQHLTVQLPEVLPYLGLPPGYRFLIAGDYRDVWFDASLLVK